MRLASAEFDGKPLVFRRNIRVHDAAEERANLLGTLNPRPVFWSVESLESVELGSAGLVRSPKQVEVVAIKERHVVFYTNNNG